jgi:predicted transposase YbfD/YdcC
VPPGPPGALPAATRHEREQRRAAAAAARPGLPGLLGQAAADGKTVRGAVRADGSQVHLLSVLDVATGCVRAQREIDAKTNEIPELAPAIAHLDLTGRVVTLDALHTQAETARHLVEDKHAHYLMIIKGNQPSLLQAAVKALAGSDAGFADASWAEEGKGHGRRERRAIRTAPADGIDWPHAAQVMRIRRDSGPTRGPWTHKEIVLEPPSAPVGRLEFAGCSASRWNIRCGWGARCSAGAPAAGRHRPGLPVPGRQPLHVRRRRGCHASGGEPVLVGLDAAAGGSGDAVCLRVPIGVNGTWIEVVSRPHPQ